jgi:RimJ/RimL family protein N-acetyltransferase
MEDVDALCEAVHESIDTVGLWLTWCHANYGVEDAIAWVRSCQTAWDREEAYPLFIFDSATNRLLGGCGLNELDRPRLRANLGYWVRASGQGQGVATEAARLTARFGLHALGFMRLEIVAAIGNLASQRVATKLGAVREGRLRNRLRIHNVQHDAFGYSLIPSDMA